MTVDQIEAEAKDPATYYLNPFKSREYIIFLAERVRELERVLFLTRESLVPWFPKDTTDASETPLR